MTGPNAATGTAATEDPLARAATVLFVHAHPDDETLSSGGLILELAARGVRVQLLTATRGERGEVVSALRDRIAVDALTGVRVDELAEAVRRLGIADAHLLGDPPARAAGLPPRRYSDSGMRWVTPTLAGPVDDAPSEALTRAPEAEIDADLRALLDQLGRSGNAPDAIVSYDDQGGYGHPDHRAIRAAALRTGRTAGIPFVELVDPDAPGAFVVDATARLDEIAHALRAHATQLTVDGSHVVHSGGHREAIATRYGLLAVR